MASLSTYIGIALGGIIILTGDLAQAQSLSGATRTQNTRSGTKKADPSEYFLVAFGHCQDAEKAAAEGNYTEAIKKAKDVGIGCVGVHNSNHFGVTGFYSDLALRENCIGLVLANTDPAIAP